MKVKLYKEVNIWLQTLIKWKDRHFQALSKKLAGLIKLVFISGKIRKFMKNLFRGIKFEFQT